VAGDRRGLRKKNLVERPYIVVAFRACACILTSPKGSDVLPDYILHAPIREKGESDLPRRIVINHNLDLC
jgi:hypothetical protein